MWTMRLEKMFWMTVILAGCYWIEGSYCLKGVHLEMIPTAVQRGHHAMLRCHYDLENAPLYSVKWYRGRHEFYRFSPSELPKSKIFPYPGIHVDLSMSNDSQVVIRDVGFEMAGNFSCEVTTDAPSFSTKVVSQHMTVVVLPERRPIIHAEKDRYDPGDILRANCSSPPSRPPATLTFLINNIAVEMGSARKYPSEDLFWSDLHLEMQLFQHHYSGGRIFLKCQAQVDTLYLQSAEIQLPTRAGDPIPERVRSPNATAPMTQNCSLHIMMFVIVCYIIR